MRKVLERGRKICTRCGAHKIMRFIPDDTCTVCGDSLAALPAIEKKHGYPAPRMEHVRLTAAR